MDKNTFIAIGLSLLILVLWPFIFSNKKVPAPSAFSTQQESVEVNKQLNQKEKKDALVKFNPDEASVKVYEIENDLLKVKVSSKGAKITQVTFKKYEDKNKTTVDFFGPFSERVGALEAEQLSKFNFVPSLQSSHTISFSSGVNKITYLLEDGSYSIKVAINSPQIDRLDFRILSVVKDGGKDDYGLSKEPEDRKKDYLVYVNDKLERTSNKDLSKNKTISFSNSPKWVGVSDRYFLFSVLGSDISKISDTALNYNESDSVYLVNYILNTSKSGFAYTIYAGPKDVDDLRKVDATLTDSIDYGWFTVISVPILELMKMFYRAIPNYGVAILLLTLFVRLLMFPLQQKSMKSMKRMQEFQPIIKQLQEKYKDDKQKLNAEMVQFMKTHKVNPMSGCLPMLIQLPVFIALYKVLASAVELYQSPFIFWITDLSVKDPYYVFPVLMGAMMFIQQKITPNPTMDPMQAKMMLYMLPILFTFLMLSLPSGLTLYIMFSTFLGIAQQYLMNKQPAKQIKTT